MGIATRVLASAGRSPDAVPAWRSAAAAFPEDEELQEGLFQSAAGSLEYAALQTAAVRLMKLKTSSAEASAGERLSASWAAATATALASAHARKDSEVGPLGKAGLSRLARAMVGKLEREKKGGAALTSQQLSLVRALTREGAGRGDAEKAAWSSSSSSSSPAAAAASASTGGGAWGPSGGGVGLESGGAGKTGGEEGEGAEGDGSRRSASRAGSWRKGFTGAWKR